MDNRMVVEDQNAQDAILAHMVESYTLQELEAQLGDDLAYLAEPVSTDRSYRHDVAPERSRVMRRVEATRQAINLKRG